MPRLPRAFYARPTLQVAADLIGKVLVHRTPAGETSGVIVEVEAYIGETDPACHAAPGPTARNQLMYGRPGHAYVYLNYGIHYLVNVVTEPRDSPAAVLIRALEPLDGIPLMRRRRARARAARRAVSAAKKALSLEALCRGPGNVTQAMGIDLRQNGLDLLGPMLYIDDRRGPPVELAWSTRIGLTVGTDRRWRCFAVGSPSVSGSL